MLYKNFSGYLKEKYGGKIRKICIDGGFTCPNRDGRCGVGGCIFCTGRGSGEHITEGQSVRAQVESFLSRASGADGYIAYFQNFTNTYDEPERLREKYDSALIDERIVALAIGTRPDCITEEIAELIASYKGRVDVWVELGLQTSTDALAQVINRGYESRVFTEAVEILNRWDIDVVAHMMIGLPYERKEDVFRTVDFLNAHKLWGVKIHSVYVAEGTMLARMYSMGQYKPIERSDYVELAAYTIAHLNPDFIIHRITGDCPEEMLVAPLWNRDKNTTIKMINEKLEENGLRQGSLYKKP